MDRDADGLIFFEHRVQSYALSTRERVLRFEPARAVKAPMCDRLVLIFWKDAVATRRQTTNDVRPTTLDTFKAGVGAGWVTLSGI